MKAAPLSGPLVNPGEAPPGRFVDGVWQGALDWCTRHGPAIVQWSVGVPTFVWSARDEVGKRCDLENAMRPGAFRRQTAEGFVHGRIQILAEDVTFTEAALEVDVDDDLLPLHDILAADAAFIGDLNDASFASALYAELENQELLHTTGGQIFELGQRSAARLVAALRNNGEIYLDYAWGRGPAFGDIDSVRVRAHLTRLGFRPQPVEDKRHE